MNEDSSRPDRATGDLPRWAVRLLQRLAPWPNRDIVLGDFAEVYRYIVAADGRRRAQRWYWLPTTRLWRPAVPAPYRWWKDVSVTA